MIYELVALLTLMNLAAPAQGGVVELRDMIQGETSYSVSQLLFHGRYCGLGNIGGKAVDGKDSCCQQHDKCYENTRTAAICADRQWYNEKYEWKSVKGAIYCGECACVRIIGGEDAAS